MIINDALRAVAPTIAALPWVERYGGVSFPFRRDEGGTHVNDKYVPNYKTYPVSDTMTNADCIQGQKYKNLIPDKRYKNLLYWEVTSDAAYTVTDHTPPKGVSFRGTARLVYWMNFAKHGIAYDQANETYAEFCARLALFSMAIEVDLINALNKKTFEAQTGVALRLDKPSIQRKDPRKIFPYDYGRDFEAVLLYPYGFGAISFDTTVHVSPNCLPDIVEGTAVNCITEW